MTLAFSDPWLDVHVGDCREVLRTLPEQSVHMAVTSPPYWGLRDYGTASWDGGDPACDHSAPSRFDYPLNPGLGPTGRCGKCGAVRIDRQLGLEPTPEEYVAAMVGVFREPVPATVLDPFGGSGTTALVAASLSRRAVLIELNPEYLTQVLARNADVPLGL